MNLLQWINQNSGVTMVILTAIYVVATIIIVYFNRLSIYEMKATREQMIAPQVVLSFEVRRGGLFCIVLRNYGGSPARYLRIDISQKWINSLPNDKERFINLKDARLTIVPKQELIYVCGGPTNFSVLAKEKLEGNIFYEDLFNKLHEEEFLIDINSLEGALMYGTEIDELTSTIKRGLEGIKKEMK